jgi:hypothetical protein
MTSNVISLESCLLLVDISLPIRQKEVLNTIKSIISNQKAPCDSSWAILVNANQIHFSGNQPNIKNLEELLLGLCEYGPAAVFGLPTLFESMLKLYLSVYDSANFPLYFVENQKAGVALIHHLKVANNPLSFHDSNYEVRDTRKLSFRNLQTRDMFRAFTAIPSLYHEWRTIVDSLYEDGEVTFETLMFAKLHNFGNADDLTIDWDSIIMTLLYDVDL